MPGRIDHCCRNSTTRAYGRRPGVWCRRRLALGCPPPPARTGLGSSFAAGYLFGGLLSLPLGEAAAPPKELGLWLRGWYKGSMDPSPSDRSSFGQGVHGLGFLAPATSHWGDDPPFVDGIVNGFLDALAITFGK